MERNNQKKKQLNTCIQLIYIMGYILITGKRINKKALNVVPLMKARDEIEDVALAAALAARVVLGLAGHCDSLLI